MFFPYLRLIFFCSLLSTFLTSLTAQVGLPPDFYDSRFAGGFQRPLGIDISNEGLLYIFEQGGTVWVVDSNGQRLNNSPLIDLSEEVSQWHDHGLLGFCLDRNFSNNGYFYLLYTVDRYWDAWHDHPAYQADSSITFAATWGRVTRYTADPQTNFTTTLANSRTVLLGATAADGIPLFYSFHGLGKIQQATDRSLLISVGDGSHNNADIGQSYNESFVAQAIDLGILSPDQNIGSYRAQYLGSLLGKILRIDPNTGAGLASNPFYEATAPRSPTSRIWALGLRNPYRFTIDDQGASHDPEAGEVGRLYIGDVGNGSWEELNIASRKGLNFGWPIYEGANLNWAFHLADDVPNTLAPNPLSDGENCPPFLGFKQSYTRVVDDGYITSAQFDAIQSGMDVEASVLEGARLLNPCDTSSTYTYLGPVVYTAPELVWSNANWNPPARAGTPFFLPNNLVDMAEIGTPASRISGESFDGYSAMVGFRLALDNWPAEYHNKFFFFDFSGWIRVADLDPQGRITSVQPFANNIRLHCLEQNPQTGRLYYLMQSHEIRQISFGGNPPPVAKSSASPRFGGSSLQVEFDASDSHDPNHPTDNLTFSWEFGDGHSATGRYASHLYQATTNSPTTFVAWLTVTDPEGASGRDSLIISLNNTPPEVRITSFKDGDRYPTNQTNLLELRATATDREHPESSLRYEWQTYLHHNDHSHPEAIIQQKNSHLFLEPLGCDEETYFFRVRLRVTDPEGLYDEVEQYLYPYCARPNELILAAQAEPNHIRLNWEGFVRMDDATFELQISSNLRDFRPVSLLDPISREYLDYQPETGTRYYRLKLISAARYIVYSNPVAVSWPPPIQLSLSPNPTAGLVQFRYLDAYPGGRVFFHLYDTVGRLVRKTDWLAPSDDQGIQRSLQLAPLPVGTYFYHFWDESHLNFKGSILLLQP